MRQILVHKDAVFLKELPEPLPNKFTLIVKVYYSFISSGTENATINNMQDSLLSKISKRPRELTQKVVAATKEHGAAGTLSLIQENLNKVAPLGYSCSGEVIFVGESVKNFKVGDFVACAGASFAYHADFVSIPENLAVKITDPTILKDASITTIGAIALQGVRRAQLQLGESVCIIGLGLIGLITVQLAKQSGCKVIAVDIIDDKLERAKKYGADVVLNAKESFVNEALFATQHHGVDATIITAASQYGTLIQNAMEVTRKKGRVILVGDVKLDFDRNPFYVKEIDFLISSSYGPGRYDDKYELEGNDYPYAFVRWTENRNMQLFVELIEQKKIDISSLISHQYNIEEADQAYAILKKSTALGIVLSYGAEQRKFEIKTAHRLELEEEEAVRYTPPAKKILLGVIGAGGFSRTKLLPLVKRIRSVSIRSIIDLDMVNCINLARHYNANQISNDYHKILTDHSINAVIIATPHAFHAQQSLDCLKAGKAVFVEKPAAVNEAELQGLKDFLDLNQQALYCVDFNRSSSPFMKKIKDVIKHRSNPMMINYRMNVPFLPPGHWIQSEENGGRIIGEACHIFELFCFLTDAEPVSLSVGVLNAPSPYLATDNFITHIRMSDGSLCSLIYTAFGNPKQGKELMELSFDGKTIVMDDFINLQGYGLPMSFNKKATRADKGHAELMHQFFKAARELPLVSPIPFERIVYASKLSFIITKLAQQGGGFCNLQDESI